jgi:hypothetical protein
MNKIIGDLRNTHSEKLHNVYSSKSTIRIIKLRNSRWPGHIAHMGKKWNAYRV